MMHSVPSVISPVMATVLHREPASNRTVHDSCLIQGHDKRDICIMPVQRIRAIPVVPEVHLLHFYCYSTKRYEYEASSWFTDGSRTDSGTGAGIYGVRPNRSFSFPLSKFASVFQTEIYAIIQCACENIRRAYKNK